MKDNRHFDIIPEIEEQMRQIDEQIATLKARRRELGRIGRIYPSDDRNKEIYNLITEGAKTKTVAERYHISVERVREIYQKYGRNLELENKLLERRE
jgi:DNA-binding NarL/FixJ family response regulator